MYLELGGCLVFVRFSLGMVVVEEAMYKGRKLAVLAALRYAGKHLIRPLYQYTIAIIYTMRAQRDSNTVEDTVFVHNVKCGYRLAPRSRGVIYAT